MIERHNSAKSSENKRQEYFKQIIGSLAGLIAGFLGVTAGVLSDLIYPFSRTLSDKLNIFSVRTYPGEKEQEYLK